MFEYRVKNNEVRIISIKDGCVESIEIPESIDGHQVTDIPHGIFSFNNRVVSVTLPNSIISIDNYVFYNCFQLKEITIPNSVNNIGSNIFRGCTKLSNINGINIKEGINVINNKFIYYINPISISSNMVFKIKYQILDDYVTESPIDHVRYIIDSYIYSWWFNKDEL